MPQRNRTGLTLTAALCLAAGCATTGAPATAAKAPLRWGDPDRLARLAAAAAELEPEVLKAAAPARAPGMAFGLVAGGQLVWFKASGTREVASGAPVDVDTVFRIASMSKAFVSAAVLQLRDEGRLSLDDPAERWLPELRGLQGPTTDSPRITVRQLLSHASGLPEDNATADLRMPMRDAEFDQLLAQGLSFSTAPGTGFEYSNLGFALAGRLVSRVAGERLQDVVTRRLLLPLGMGATRWEGREVQEAHKAHGYGRKGSAMPSEGLDRYQDDAPHEEPELADGAWAPIGGLWTSPRDYARWVAFQLSASPPRSEPEAGPVRRASLREAQQVQRATPLSVSRSDDGELQASAGGYGLGWGVRSTCSYPRVVSHSGGLPGYGSYVALLPEQDVGVFAMTNLTYTGVPAAAFALLEGLRARGLLPVRPVETSAQLQRARAGVLELLAGWDPARAQLLMDVNHGAYEAPEALQARLAAFTRLVGACRAAPGDQPENALRGRLRLACERGEAELLVELTSDLPPRVQTLVLEPALAPGEALTRAAAGLTTLSQAWDPSAAAALFAAGADLGGLRRDAARVAAAQGTCAGPRPLRGDGTTRATFRLRCERGEADLTLKLDPASGRPVEAHLATAPGTLRCPK